MRPAKYNALVTGSTSGIGLAIARAMAKEGANVVLNGFGDAAEIEKTAQRHRIRVRGHGALRAADMSKPDEIVRMVRSAEQRLGAIDMLVNNAGIQHVAPIEEFPPEKWDAIIAINLSSAFHTIRAAVPGMKARKWGRIINTASAHSLVASPFKSAYVARQARHRRPDQDGRARTRDVRRHGELHLARAMSGRRSSRSRSPTRWRRAI